MSGAGQEVVDNLDNIGKYSIENSDGFDDMKEKSYEKMTDTITSCMINLIYTLLEPIEKMVTAILSCLRKNIRRCRDSRFRRRPACGKRARLLT